MNKSLATKLLEIQAAVPTLPKNTEGYGYKYTALDDVMDVLRPHLDAQGLALTHNSRIDDGKLYLVTMLIDAETGESYDVTVPLYSQGGKNPMQELGASITYARRYALGMMFALCFDEDTDGVLKSKVEKSKASVAPKLSDRQLALLREMLGSEEVEAQYMKTWAHSDEFDRLEDFTGAHYKQLQQHIQQWLLKRGS